MIRLRGLSRSHPRVPVWPNHQPMNPRSLLEMLVRLNVVRGPYQCEAGMVSAIVTRREGFTEDRGNFMLFGVHRVMNDFVDS
jgi:hypothetical protein